MKRLALLSQILILGLASAAFAVPDVPPPSPTAPSVSPSVPLPPPSQKAPPGSPTGPAPAPGRPGRVPPPSFIANNSLRAVDEVAGLESVVSANIVVSNFGYGIRFVFQASSACGHEYFVNKFVPGEISFYQLGLNGVAHVQPACLINIEYVWNPTDYNLKVGDTSVKTIVFGAAPRFPGDGKRFQVQVTLTGAMGPMPSGHGTGIYATLSNLSVTPLP